MRLLSARDNNGDAKRVGVGAEAQGPGTYAVILIKTQAIQQATPYNHSASDIYAELNVIWIVRSQTDGTRVAGGKLYCCVNKTAIAMLHPNFLDQNWRGFMFYFSHNRWC